MDTTFDFERRRNIPTRYNRDVMASTLKAMQRVQEIKNDREERYYENRYGLLRYCRNFALTDVDSSCFSMRPSKRVKKQEALRSIKRDIDLVQSSLARQQVDTNRMESEKIAEESNKMVDAEAAG